MLHRPAFVYFDLDDTLLDHRHAERTALADVWAAHRDAFGGWQAADVQDVYHRHNSALWPRFADGALTRDDVKRLRFEQTLHDLAVDTLDADDLGALYLERYAAHWHLPDAARDAFHAVADRYPVGLLTNGFADIQRAKLARFPALHDRLQTLVISEEVGVMKPHRGIFEHAAQEAATEPVDLLYIGDSYRSDVQGALGAGWQVAWYTADGASAPASVFRFKAWPDLLDHLL